MRGSRVLGECENSCRFRASFKLASLTCLYMNSWEDEELKTPVHHEVSINTWIGEDKLEQTVVKDSWEDEDPPPKPPGEVSSLEGDQEPAKPKKPPKRKKKKSNPKKEKDEEIIQPVSLEEKQRRQELVEKSDFEHTEHLLGVASEKSSQHLIIEATKTNVSQSNLSQPTVSTMTKQTTATTTSANTPSPTPSPAPSPVASTPAPAASTPAPAASTPAPAASTSKTTESPATEASRSSTNAATTVTTTPNLADTSSGPAVSESLSTLCTHLNEILRTKSPKELTDKELEDVAQNLADCARLFEHHPRYRVLLKLVLKTACAPLEPEDINEIDNAIHIQINEKLKQRKGGKRRTSTTTKKTLNIDKDDVLVGNDDDDYDFM